jgi:hypothetical protein
MRKLLALSLILLGCSHSSVHRSTANVEEESLPLFVSEQVFKDSAKTKLTPWGGYWWSMQHGELARGWDDEEGREEWSEAEVRQFDQCLASYSKDCVALLKEMTKDQSRSLSPLMKFDYWVRIKLEQKYGKKLAPENEYTHAALWEINNHYIGNNQTHRYYSSQGYAGKCLGWAFSTMENPEPTKEKIIDGIFFRPSDIKGYLASIYNAGQFFVPEKKVIGHEFHNNPNSNSREFYNDVSPKDLIVALQNSIKMGKMLEADMDPGDGVWNHPIYQYELEWSFKSKNLIHGKIVLHYPTDELEIDTVFSLQKKRQDLLKRELKFSLKVDDQFEGDFKQIKESGTWLGESKDMHPDAIILGLEDGWRKTVYEYKDTQMKTEVNYPFIKREKVNNLWQPIIDGLLKNYYK